MILMGTWEEYSNFLSKSFEVPLLTMMISSGS